ncbi:MAG: chorismate mutase [Spirochaetaceae bacterium]|jgi:chorismate mutase|nr:chorismate mutase [Spirochaetaceae bacterium]
MKKIVGIRGATQCRNEAEDIIHQVSALYEGLLNINNLAEPDIVSIIFSVTSDLDAKNPAAALRSTGHAGQTPLFAVQEAAIVGSLERVIRILMHCYLNEAASPLHLYRNGAEVLRPDFPTEV